MSCSYNIIHSSQENGNNPMYIADGWIKKMSYIHKMEHYITKGGNPATCGKFDPRGHYAK